MMCVEKNVFEFTESGLLPQGCHEFFINYKKQFKLHEKKT